MKFVLKRLTWSQCGDELERREIGGKFKRIQKRDENLQKGCDHGREIYF